MKILAIAFVYNEIDYLPFAVKYYRDQGCQIYVIDNCSDDGTWEWLQSEGIPSHRFDTQGAFQLQWLQEEMVKTIHSLKPDWFLWFSPDLFHVFDSKISINLKMADEKGFNQIKTSCYSFKNTGEQTVKPALLGYEYAHKNEMTCLVSKYKTTFSFDADKIKIMNPKQLRDGVILEYGGCKPAEIQEIKLQRRQRAWKMGTPKGHGQHYRAGKKNNWIWKRSELVHVPSVSGMKFYINKLKAHYYLSDEK